MATLEEEYIEAQDGDEIDVTARPQFTIRKRLNAFTDEWVAFLRKLYGFHLNQPRFHLWRGFGQANRCLLHKMERMANQFFRGVLTEESLSKFVIYVKQLQYVVSAWFMTHKEVDNEKLLEFIDNYTRESFEHIDHWNWELTKGNDFKLVEFIEKDLQPDPDFFYVDHMNLNAFSPFIQFHFDGGSDGEDEEDDFEGGDEGGAGEEDAGEEDGEEEDNVVVTLNPDDYELIPSTSLEGGQELSQAPPS